MRRACLTLGVALLAALTPSASARQTATLHATLTPEHLGKGTTLGFGFELRNTRGAVPPPLTAIELRYPADLGIALSGLGLETCLPQTLALLGLAGCSANSLMGLGNATVEIPIGPAIVREHVSIALVRAPVQEGRFALVFYANGVSPIAAQLALPALLLQAPPPFGGKVDINLPLVPSLPDAPDVSLVKLQATLGPEHLLYYERVHGRLMSYRPRGITLPSRCPRGGFPFQASFAFVDGSSTAAHTAVPCPGRARGG